MTPERLSELKEWYAAGVREQQPGEPLYSYADATQKARYLFLMAVPELFSEIERLAGGASNIRAIVSAHEIAIGRLEGQVEQLLAERKERAK